MTMTVNRWAQRTFYRSYAAMDRLFQEQLDPWHFETSPYEQARYAKMLALLERVPHERILEVGCAEGCFTERLAAVSKELTAIDLSAAALERAKRRVPTVNFVQTTLEAMTIPERPYDVIVCGEVLYYIEDKQRALAGLARSGTHLLTSSCLPPALFIEAKLRCFPLVRRQFHGRLRERKWSVLSLRQLASP